MAGHSKWSNIKHKKAAADAKRGKIFTKIVKEVSIAAKQGGGDPDANARLRLAIANAKSQSVPKDTIQRAIDKATGNLEGQTIDEILYEAYGPHGVAILIEVATDNKNRSVSDIKNILTRHDGSMAEAGAVAWGFDRKGQVIISDAKYENVEMDAIENGADDIQEENGVIQVISSIDDFEDLRSALEKKYTIEEAGLTYIPQNFIKVDKVQYDQLEALYEKLDDHDDVMKLHTNEEYSG